MFLWKSINKGCLVILENRFPRCWTLPFSSSGPKAYVFPIFDHRRNNFQKCEHVAPHSGIHIAPHLRIGVKGFNCFFAGFSINIGNVSSASVTIT